MFGASGARHDAINRVIKRLNDAGELEGWRIDHFELPDLGNDYEYSTFIFNDEHGSVNELKPSIRVIPGGK